MCLPLKFLKQITRHISQLLGFIGICMIITSFLTDSLIVIQLMRPIGILTVIVAISGFAGQKYKNCCCMGLFNCGMLTLLVIIFFGIIVILFKGEWYEQHRFYNLYGIAKVTLCSNNCICYINPTTQWPSPTYLQDNNYIYNDDNHSPVQYQECEDSDNDHLQEQLEYIELHRNCSGYEQQLPIYLFSDVNRGVPESSCLIYILDTIQSSLQLALVGFEVLFISFLLMCFMSCCLCCHPERKQARMYPYIQYSNADFI